MTELAAGKIIIESLQGDTLTPISIFQRLTGKKKFLFESSLKHEDSGRYSFIGADPVYEIKSVGEKTIVVTANKEEIHDEKPIVVLKSLIPELEAPEHIPFNGGAVGFVAYDVIRHYEEIGPTPRDEINVPDVHFMVYEELIIFDHLQQRVYAVGVPLLASTTIENLKERLQKRKEEILTGMDLESSPVQLTAFESTLSKDQFIDKVRKAKGYIVDGDIFQVVLSQRMKAKLTGEPFSFYRHLRVHNPSPYMYFLDFGGYIVAGASPESLIKANHRQITTNPIAGTRPRGRTTEADEKLVEELLQDEKELAEHQMLVDLGRNDLGRVSEFGSIRLEKYMEIEKFKHVMHIVSEVSGKLRAEFHPLDALISCLPAGTVSGAPKIRAMEIINELEAVKRGIYSGAIGYYSANGNMDFALAIRTMVVKGEDTYIQAGAGIVYDSVPEMEYEETLHKLKAFLEEK